MVNKSGKATQRGVPPSVSRPSSRLSSSIIGDSGIDIWSGSFLWALYPSRDPRLGLLHLPLFPVVDIRA